MSTRWRRRTRFGAAISSAIEVRVTRVHAHPEIMMDGEPNRIDPDKWRPLIMSFQQFYGLTPEKLQRSELGQIPETAVQAAGLAAGGLTSFPNHVPCRDQAAAGDQDRGKCDIRARLGKARHHRERRSRAAAWHRRPHLARGCRRASCRYPMRRTPRRPGRSPSAITLSHCSIVSGQTVASTSACTSAASSAVAAQKPGHRIGRHRS